MKRVKVPKKRRKSFHCKVLNANRINVQCATSIAFLRDYPNNYFTACITDPPYGLAEVASNDGQRSTKAWGTIANPAFSTDHWRSILRVLKPGAFCLSMGSTRTYHRMACAMEDAGFEVIDCLMWMYGTGMPKTRSIEKELKRTSAYSKSRETLHPPLQSAIDTDQWQDFGTGLKPCYDPILLCRKPMMEEGKRIGYRESVIRHGVGGLNIGATRIPVPYGFKKGRRDAKDAKPDHLYKGLKKSATRHDVDYFPRNIILNPNFTTVLDHHTLSHVPNPCMDRANFEYIRKYYTTSTAKGRPPRLGKADTNNQMQVSKFFYCPKPAPYERQISSGKYGSGKLNTHPTIKPIALCRYLLDLVTYPETPTQTNRLLDPCCGSGTFLVAAALANIEAHGCDLEQEYVDISRQRCREAAIIR